MVIGMLCAVLAGAGAAAAGDTEPPVPEAQIVPSEVEVGQNVGFVGSATDGGVEVTNPNLFNWTFEYNGSTVTLHGQTTAYRFYVPGTYTVTLQVDDAAGNRASTNETVVVKQKSPGPGANPAPPASSTPGFEVVAVVAALATLVGLHRRPQRQR